MSATAALTYPTPFGAGWVAYTDDRLVGLGLPGTPNPHPPGRPSVAALDLAEQLERYWQGGALPPVSPDMIEAGCRTELDELIYRRVASIRPGCTMTYGEVARSVGRPGAARAVGAAMAANRFAPVIPCHRVVGSDGSLRGYGGGLDMKRYLLEMESNGDA